MKLFTTPAAAVTMTAALACWSSPARAQVAPVSAQLPASAPAPTATLPTVTINASADASAAGLSPAYPGGQVGRGGRAGILGTRDNMETPFSITSYTNELIQDRQARSVGDVLQNDSGVRVARGFGNFQESYFIRGFILGSDDVAYNGLYSLLPRQYIATELFERVEVLRGASTFLSGVSPGGDGIGGAINLVPKRATAEPLTRVTFGGGSGSQGNVSADVARRFGPDQSTGVRINAAFRDGGTAIDDEKAKTSLLAAGLDWHSGGVRLSGDLGWQENRLKRTRTNITLVNDPTKPPTQVPALPDASDNYAQPWSYSNERDLFGTARGELDLTADVTAWAAYGLRRSDEGNSLANLDLTDSSTGAGTVARFDNTRKDKVDTGEVGLRGKLRTGSVGHEWVASAAYFQLETRNAYAFDFFNALDTNLYHPVDQPRPAFSADAFLGNDLASPALTHRTKLTSFALGDTVALADDRLLVTLGARHQKLELTDYAYTTGVKGDPYDRSRTSPMLGVVFKASPQFAIYGNYIEGLTQGETAPTAPQPPHDTPPLNAGQTLAPYVSKQKEVGLKYDGGRLGAGLALFSTTRPRALTTGDNVFASEGKDRHQGVELTAYGEATRGLKVLGGATWLDAQQHSTGSDATDGKRVIGVPRLYGNLGAEWDVPALTGLAVDARVVATGASYADAANQVRVPGWGRLDVGARYLWNMQNQLVTLRARVDNLFDRAYWGSVGGYPGSGYLVIGAPRSFVVSASVDF